MSGPDVELRHLSNAPPVRLEGYPSFAHFIALDGDAMIYRKYSHMSARNLLYLQSEIHELDEQLRQLDREDAKDIDNEEPQKAAREWRYYLDPQNDRACQHRVLQGKIRVKLNEYRAYTNHQTRTKSRLAHPS